MNIPTQRLCTTGPLLALLLWASACSSNEEKTTQAEQPYHIAGTIMQDSLHHDAPITVIADRQGHLSTDTLDVARGRFAYRGHTIGVDELYLYDAAGHCNHLYAAGGQDLEIEIDSLGRLQFLDHDSINGWLADMKALVDGLPPEVLQHTVDSICQQNPDAVRATLLLRETLLQLPDSVGIRRTLGVLSRQAKPEWLMNSIERMLDLQFASIKPGDVITKGKIAAHDTTLSFQGAVHPGILMVVWADYSQSSIDSLQLLNTLARRHGLYQYAKNYSGNRPKLELLSVCVNASDSDAWLGYVKDLPGRHAWLKAGLSDPRLRRWKIRQIPAIILVNPSGNVLSTEGGEALSEAIKRIPTQPAKTNLRHTPAKSIRTQTTIKK